MPFVVQSPKVRADAKLKRDVARRLREILDTEGIGVVETLEKAKVGRGGLYRLLGGESLSIPVLLKVAAFLGYEVQILLVRKP